MLGRKQVGLSALFFLAMSFIAVMALNLPGIAANLAEDILPLVVFGIGAPVSIAMVWVIISAAQGRAWAIQTYLGVMVFMTDALFRKRGLAELSIDWHSALKFAVVLGALVIGSAQWKKNSALLLRPPLLWMLLYALWAILSASYSVTPVYTLAAGIMFLSFVLFAATVAQSLPLRQALIGMIISWAIFIVLSWGVFCFLPELGRTSNWAISSFIDRFAGLAGNPNNMGRLLSLVIVVLALLHIHRYLSPLLLLTLLLGVSATLLLTLSRTATASAILSIAVIFMRGRPMLVFPILALGTVIITALEFIPYTIDITMFSRSGDLDELSSFTGRTQIWSFCLDKIKQEPWIGYGYAGSRLVISQGWASKYGWTTMSSHNLWLQSLLTVGVIGTLPLLLAVGKQLVDLFKQPYPLRDVTLVFVLISGMLEAGAIGPTPNLLTFFWLFAISKAMVYEKSPSV